VKVTETLIIQLRPLESSDLEHFRRLRTQEAVMVNTQRGVIDATLEESQQWMDRHLPPNDANTYVLVIWAKEDEETWEHIGTVGCHIISPVPVVGYMLRTEWWGRSIATKALQAFIEHWWTLDRRIVEVSIAKAKDEHCVHKMKLETSQRKDQVDVNEVVPEILLAEIDEKNIPSIRVITKCGFHYRGCWPVTQDGIDFVIRDYTLSRPQ